MFYICSRNNEDGTFGIVDTEDGVIEYYNPKTIRLMLSHLHLNIEGAKISDGKLKITIKKPTKFEDRGTYDESGAKIINSGKQNIPITSVNNTKQTGVASEFDGLYETILRSEFIDKLQNSAGFIIRALNKVIGGITHITFEDILDLDGWDCVGFENIHVKNHPEFTVSIYTNPEVSVIDSGNGHWSLVEVKSNGFGVDLYKGREIISHIDGSWKTWEKDIEESDGYKLIYGKKIVPLEEMLITDYDNLVYPLFKSICDVINRILVSNYNVSDVQYLDGYDCVGINTTAMCQYGKVDVSVYSNGLMDYDKTGEIGRNVGVDYILHEASLSEDINIPYIVQGYTNICDNKRIHIEIPSNAYDEGLSAAYLVMHTVLN